MLRRDVKLLASCFSLWLLLAVTAIAQGPPIFPTAPTCSTGTGGTNSPCVLLPAAVGTPYSETLTVTGGTPPYHWALIAGSLPTGMTLDPNTGILSAINLSSALGNTVIQVMVTDSAGAAVSQNFSLSVSAPGSRQRSGVLPQIAAGAGWGTTIYLSNTTGLTATAQIAFHDPGGNALALPVQSQQPGFASMSTTASALYYVIPPNSTITIHNTNSSASTLLQGWADILTTGGVSAFAIFRQTFLPGVNPALPNGGFTEGVAAQQGLGTCTLTLPFDNTNNSVTAVALASISNLPPSVTANVYDVNGTLTSYPVPPSGTLTALGQAVFTLPDNFPASKNTTGFVTFQNGNCVNTQGQLAGLALRFNSGVFVSLPAFVLAPATTQ